MFRSRQLRQALLYARGGLVLTAVSNLWLMLFLGRSVEDPTHRNESLTEWPLPWLLLIGALVAVAMHTFAVALNDAMDVRHDRLFRAGPPQRDPRVDRGGPVALAMLFLLAGIAASAALGMGPLILCVLLALAVLFYDTIGKYLPAVGLISFGLIRLLLMFLPNPQLGFAWPIWFAFTHVVCCMAVGWHMVGKRPRLRGDEIILLCAGWGFWTLALIGWMSYQHTLHPPAAADLPLGGPGVWLLPLTVAVVFLALCIRMIPPRLQATSGREHRATGEAFIRWSLICLILYDAGWLLGLGLARQATIHLGLFMLAAILNVVTYHRAPHVTPPVAAGLTQEAAGDAPWAVSKGRPEA